MNDTEDICPVSDNGNHRYFIFKVFDLYEPVKNQGSLYDDTQLYEKVEYAVSGCNCGSTIKQVVKQR